MNHSRLQGRAAALSLVALCAALAPTPVAAQNKTDKHPELGLVVTRPLEYEPVPLPPGAEFTVLRYVWRAADAPAESIAPTLLIHVVERPREGAEPSLVYDTETFVRRHVMPDAVRPLRGGASRYGYQPRRFELDWKLGGRPYRTWIHGWEGPTRSVIVAGTCEPEQYLRERRRWLRVAETLRLTEVSSTSPERARLERYYGQRRFRNAEYRIGVRLAMVEGWEARDTENYIVLYHADDPGMVQRFCSDLEFLRRELQRDFPPLQETTAVSTVRLCEDRAEYLDYGGWAGAWGYWSPAQEELVLYRRGELSDDPIEERYTMQTLYHEAFHQYIYYSVGRVAPHSWFNEGMGEYYAGAQMSSGRVQRVGQLDRSIASLQSALIDGADLSLAGLLRMDLATFYAKADLHYPAAWSLVYFLRTAPGVRRNGAWSRILPRYFDGLKRAHAAELAEDPQPTQARALLAAGRARAEALEEALKGVDVEELEAAWLAFVRGLKWDVR